MHACSFQWQLSSPPTQARRRLTGLREENKDKRNERRTPGPWHRAFFFPDFQHHAACKENMLKAMMTIYCSTFTFMHLADAFIQSDLHCIQVTVFTFLSLLSLGIEPMILPLLAPCSTIWATGRLNSDDDAALLVVLFIIVIVVVVVVACVYMYVYKYIYVCVCVCIYSIYTLSMWIITKMKTITNNMESFSLCVFIVL